MTTRINIIHWIIRTINIQMSCFWFSSLSSISILCHKPSIFRIIIPCIQIIQSCTLIIDSSRITNLILCFVIAIDRCFPKVCIPVRCIGTSIFFYKTCATSLDIFIIQQIVRMVTSISLCCNDISIGSDQVLGCLAVLSIGYIGNYSVLIVIVRCFASFHFLDPLSVSVITVLLDHGCFSIDFGCLYLKILIDLCSCQGMDHGSFISIRSFCCFCCIVCFFLCGSHFSCILVDT